LGGGAFINKNIREEILKNHLSFWLKWDSKILIKRIKNSLKRPLAKEATNNELMNIINKRSNIYSKALFKVNCNNLTKNEIANKILDKYENNQANN
jgi:shikimate kinase/shikimate kinase/3-dehydroquinate synthase